MQNMQNMGSMERTSWYEGYAAGVADSTPNFVVTGRLVVNTDRQTLVVGDDEISLTPIEAVFMKRLACNLGRWVQEPEMSWYLWDGIPVESINRKSRIDYLQSVTYRVRKKLRPYSLSDMILSTVANSVPARMLVKRPPDLGEEVTPEQEYRMGYSRAEARKILVNATEKFRTGQLEEGEALVNAVIRGLPDYRESALLPKGRPNLDQRVVDAVSELGGDARYVQISEIARYLKVTVPFVSKALQRAREREADVFYRPTMGYCLKSAQEQANINAKDLKRNRHGQHFKY